jgi:hypothetical protein
MALVGRPRELGYIVQIDESMSIHPNIHTSLDNGPLAMHMTMKMNRPTFHVVPRLDGVMAEYHRLACNGKLSVMLARLKEEIHVPKGGLDVMIVVAEDDVDLFAIQAVAELFDLVLPAEGPITEVVEGVMPQDRLVDQIDNPIIMLFLGVEIPTAALIGPLTDATNDIFVRIVGVGNEPDQSILPS